MAQYPRINVDGAMLALRAAMAQNVRADYNPERMAHECSELVRLARRHRGIATKRCNVPCDERDDQREARIRERIVALSTETFRKPPSYIEFGGDPRGSTVALSWGSNRITLD